MDNTVANIQDNFGLTPLHLACKLNRKKLVELLIVSLLFLVADVFKLLFWKIMDGLEFDL